MSHPDIERRIREIGYRISTSVSGIASLFDRMRWVGRLIETAIRDETFKTKSEEVKNE